MKIVTKRKLIGYPKQVNTPNELIDHLINDDWLHNFRQLTEDKRNALNQLITQNMVIYKSRLQEQIKKIFYSLTHINTQYWIDRGWSLAEADLKISEIQKRNNDKFKIKKYEHPEKYIGITSTQLDYWLKRGYSENDAKIQLKKRQQTFTLQKCLDKYGEIEGFKKWKNRQNKWIHTLSMKSDEEIKRINKTKGECVINMVNSQNINKHIDRQSFTENNKNNIKQALTESCDLRTFILSYLKYTNNNFLFTNIQIIAYSKIIQSYFHCTKLDILSEVCLIMEEQNIKTGAFGNIMGYGGLKLKSYGEFLIANFLDDNNIKYEYERKYPDSRKRCDFYLVDYNIYVEYTGMYKQQPNTKILVKYNQNTQNKKDVCSTKKLNCLFNSKINIIFDTLKTLINGKN